MGSSSENSAPAFAKLTRPSFGGVYPRERLFRRLDHGRSRAAVWIEGAAGSGKTTLVASYLEQKKLPHIWFRVDETDADIASFFYYMGRAVWDAADGKGPPQPLLTPEYLPGLQVFSRKFFRDTYERFEQPFVIVLDDYQKVSKDSQLHGVVRCAIEEMPDHGCLVVISRDAAPKEFSRLRASQFVFSIGWKDLRVTREDFKEVVKRWRTEHISEQALEALYEKSDGWIAGVVLLHEQLLHNPAPAALESSNTYELVFDFFVSEGFEQITQPVREFLLTTAFFPEMSPDMARKLTGNPDAEQILSDLNSRNYFTSRYLIPEPVYQYHALFRDFLLARAKDEYSASDLNRTCCNAAHILETVNRPEMAFPLLADSEAWDDAIQLIRNHGFALVGQGRSATVEEWLSRLPESRLTQQADLLHLLGVCLMTTHPSLARNHLEHAFSHYRLQGDTDGMFSVWPTIVDSFIYEWHDFRPLMQWVNVFEELLQPHLDELDPQQEAAVALGMFNALMFCKADNEALPRWGDRLERLLPSVDNPAERFMIAARLAQYFSVIGAFERAGRLLGSVECSANLEQMPPLVRLTWASIRAIHYWCSGKFGSCTETVETALGLSRTTGVYVCDYFLLAQGAYGRLSEGAVEDARSYLDRMSKFVTPSRPLDAGLYHYLVAWAGLLEGNLSHAHEHLREALFYSSESGFPFAESLHQLAMAQVLLEMGKAKQAEKHLKCGYEWADRIGSPHLRFMALILDAYGHLSKRKDAEARVLLREAMEIGHHNGYVNFPYWRREIMAPVLCGALEAGATPEYVRKLIVLRNVHPDVPPVHVTDWPWPIQVNTFGRFEVMVNGQPVRFSRKAQKRPLELLKALISRGGVEVPEGWIADALWPEADGDAGQLAVTSTLHRLRKLIGTNDAIVRKEGALTLDRHIFWVDTWAFQYHLDQVENARGDPKTLIGHARKALALYQGTFLMKDEHLPWTISPRERFRSRFVRLSCMLGEALEAQGRGQEAVVAYETALELEPLSEVLYRHLIVCHQRLHNPHEAMAAYSRCRHTLLEAEDREPNSELKRLLPLQK